MIIIFFGYSDSFGFHPDYGDGPDRSGFARTSGSAEARLESVKKLVNDEEWEAGIQKTLLIHPDNHIVQPLMPTFRKFLKGKNLFDHRIQLTEQQKRAVRKPAITRVSKTYMWCVATSRVLAKETAEQAVVQLLAAPAAAAAPTPAPATVSRKPKPKAASKPPLTAAAAVAAAAATPRAPKRAAEAAAAAASVVASESRKKQKKQPRVA
jgi:hypothetical protein